MSNSLGHEGLDVVHQVFAVIRVHFQSDRLAQVQAEDTQNGLRVHHVTAGTQVHIVRITVDHVYKGLDILSQTQLDVDGFHASKAPPSIWYETSIRYSAGKIKGNPVKSQKNFL